jgi:hypothetical protein
VDEKTRERLVLAVENAIRVSGAKNYEAGMKQALKLIEFVHTGIRSIQTIDDLRTTLDSCLPMSKSEEKIAVLAISFLPQILRIGLKMAAQEAQRTLPALPGGRPRAITAIETAQVRDFVSKLIREGSTLKAAKDRASRKFVLSKRTIERIWSGRKAMPENEPTIKDALRYITTHGE